jgi:hypothetical protein
MLLYSIELDLIKYIYSKQENIYNEFSTIKSNKLENEETYFLKEKDILPNSLVESK